MTATMMTMDDVEHLAASLDAPFGDLDPRDQELLQAIFAMAGEAAASHGDPDDEAEVSGFSFSWQQLPAVQHPAVSSPLLQSFTVGFNQGSTGPVGAIHNGELNPQPLPP